MTKKRRKTQTRSDESRESNTARDSCKSEEQIAVPFNSPQEFEEKAKLMPAKDWARACTSLSKQIEENTSDIRESTSGDFCAQCEEAAKYVATVARNALERSQYAL